MMRFFESLWFSDSEMMKYFGIFFRRRMLVMIPAVAGLVLGIVLGGVLPKVYQASTLILVDEGKSMNPLIQGLAVSTPAAARLRTLREQILSWDRLVKLVSQLQLGKGIQDQAEFERLIMGLRDKIIIQLRGPNIIRIAYEADRPEQAQDVVKAVMGQVVDENIQAQTKESGAATNFLQGQLKVYRRKIKESEIAQMEDELNRLLVDSTEAHPLVIDLRQRIQKVRGDMEATEKENPPPRPMTDPMFEKVKEAVEANRSLGVVGGPSLQPPAGMDPQLFGLYVLMSQSKTGVNDVSVNTRIYNDLLARLETARMTQELDASLEGTTYTVLDPPRLPLKPVKPNRVVMALLGLFLGVTAGAGIVLLMEMADRSFHTAEEVAEYLNLAVVGTINTIWTNNEVQRRQVQNRFALLAASGVVVTVLVGSAILSWTH